MKLIEKLFYYFKISAIFLGSFFLISTVFAKEITLYAEPNPKSATVGKIDLSIGLIPIYSPKDRTWVKVADPRNGNVGWIKSSDMENSNSTITFTQRIIDDENNPQSMHIIQYGPTQITSQKVSKEQAEKFWLNLQKQQKEMQQSIQKMIQQWQHDSNILFPSETNSYFFPTPIIIFQPPIPNQDNKTSVVKPTSTNKNNNGNKK